MTVSRLAEQCWELLTDNGDPYEDVWEHPHYTSERAAAEDLAAHQKDADDPTPGFVSMVEGYCVTVACDGCGAPFDETDAGSPTHFAEADAADVRGYIGPEFTAVGEKDLCPGCALGTQGSVTPPMRTCCPWHDGPSCGRDEADALEDFTTPIGSGAEVSTQLILADDRARDLDARLAGLDQHRSSAWARIAGRESR